MDMLVNELTDINLLMNAGGSRGFGIELQTRIRNLILREEVMETTATIRGWWRKLRQPFDRENFSTYMPNQLPERTTNEESELRHCNVK